MTTNEKRFTLNPIVILISGVVLVAISYLFDSSFSFIKTIVQVVGIMFVIFGIILWSARFNSKRKV